MKLPEEFYQAENVIIVARNLLGKALFTRCNGTVTGGIIVETEAYSWTERGCHAYRKRRTSRNAIMFEKGGHAYVYLCYGIHYLFNVVTNVPGIPEAVLVRALEPLEGMRAMEKRRGRRADDYQLTSGPGKLTQALAIDRSMNGKYLLENEVWIEDVGKKIASNMIVAGRRIGIDYAGEDALLPWRFTIKGNRWVSRAS